MRCLALVVVRTQCYFKLADLLMHGSKASCVDIAKRLNASIEDGRYDSTLKQYVFRLIRLFSNDWSAVRWESQKIMIGVQNYTHV